MFKIKPFLSAAFGNSEKQNRQQGGARGYYYTNDATRYSTSSGKRNSMPRDGYAYVSQQPYHYSTGSLNVQPPHPTPYRHSMDDRRPQEFSHEQQSQYEQERKRASVTLDRPHRIPRKSVNFTLPAETIAHEENTNQPEDTHGHLNEEEDRASSTDETLPIPSGPPVSSPVEPKVTPSAQSPTDPGTPPTLPSKEEVKLPFQNEEIKMEDSVVGMQTAAATPNLPPRREASSRKVEPAPPTVPQRRVMPRSVSQVPFYPKNPSYENQGSMPPQQDAYGTLNRSLKRSVSLGQKPRQPQQFQQQQQPQQPLYSRQYAPTPMDRVDVSASVAGSPLDPRVNDFQRNKAPFTLQQYQTFTQVFSAYRRQIQAMSSATETLVRALEELSGYVPHPVTPIPVVDPEFGTMKSQSGSLNEPSVSDEQQARWIRNLDFLIDTSQMIANTHETWATTLERDIEQPLFNSVQEIMTRASVHKQQYRERISFLVQKLSAEEDFAHRMYKRRTRDMSAMQQSLATRIQCVEEIQWREAQYARLNDLLAQNQLNQTLAILSRGVPAMMNTYETLLEGFSKIGAELAQQSDSKKPIDASLENQVTRVSSISLSRSKAVHETATVPTQQQEQHHQHQNPSAEMSPPPVPSEKPAEPQQSMTPPQTPPSQPLQAANLSVPEEPAKPSEDPVPTSSSRISVKKLNTNYEYAQRRFKNKGQSEPKGSKAPAEPAPSPSSHILQDEKGKANVVLSKKDEMNESSVSSVEIPLKPSSSK